MNRLFRVMVEPKWADELMVVCETSDVNLASQYYNEIKDGMYLSYKADTVKVMEAMFEDVSALMETDNV